MKRFVKNIINAYIKRSHWYNEVLFRDCSKFWNLGNELFDVVNLGSSSGVYDFCYDGCGLSGSNWAVAPQSVLGDFVILKKYRNHIKNGGVVIYPLCPFTAISGGVPFLAERCYSFIDYNSFPGGHYIIQSRVLLAKNNPIRFYPLVEFFKDIFFHIFNKSDFIMSDDKMKLDAEVIINDWKKQFGIRELNSCFIDRFNDVYKSTLNGIGEIVDYCKSENLKLVFVFPPVYRALAELFPPLAREQLLDSFIKDVSSYDVTFFNFIDHSEFTDDISLFRNSYYLNVDGAIKFTKYLLKRL